jgi:hypothetical protein
MGDCCNALQQSSKGGPRSCAPDQPRYLLNERNERPRVDGRRTSIGQVRSADGSSSFGTNAKQQLILRVRQRSSVLCRAWWPSRPRYSRDLDHAIFTDWPVAARLTLPQRLGERGQKRRLLAIGLRPDYLSAAQNHCHTSIPTSPTHEAPLVRGESLGPVWQPASLLSESATKALRRRRLDRTLR